MNEIFMYNNCSWPSLHVTILTCLDRVVLYTHSNTGNISALFLYSRLLDQQKLARAQIGPVEFGEIYTIWEKKTTYSLRNDNFVSRGLQRTSTKIGKNFTLYHQELIKRRPILCAFCTQSVIRGLMRLFVLLSPFRITNTNTNTCCLCSTAQCV